jgi:ABC-type branched-subunit amino acid transport system substrate-binding protein
MSSMGRRRFLQLAGAAAAAAAVPGALAVQVGGRKLGPLGPVGRLKVGVLVPTGARDPRIGAQLLDGLRVGFAETAGSGGIDASLATRIVVKGYGGAWLGARDLIERQRVNVLVAGVTAPVARNLKAMAAKRNVPLVVVNVGAHVDRPAEASPDVLHHSVGFWRSNFALGRWAVQNIGPRAHVIASELDAGYDSLYAFRRGVESAGGEIVATSVTTAGAGAASAKTFAAAFGAVRRGRPDFVHGMYSGETAAAFLRAYRRSSVGRTPLTGSSFMVDDDVLVSVGRAAEGVTTCSSWSVHERSEGSAAARVLDDAYAVLGYEAARLIRTGFERARQLGLGTSGIVRALSGRSVAGAQGMLKVDRSGNVVLAPLWIRRVEASGRGHVLVSRERAEQVSAFPEELAAMRDGIFSSWVNEYRYA